MNAAGIERSCTSKNRYPTPLIAEGVAATRFQQSGTCLRVYACAACAGWHLTSLNAEAPTYRPPPTPRERKAFERRQRERRGVRHGRRR